MITRYHYDDNDRLEWSETTVEPEWDDHSRAAIAAYLDYRDSLHTCGRPLSESLHLEGRPDPTYVIGEQQCVGCKALRTFVDKHHKKDGLPAESVLTVYSRAEAMRIREAQAAELRPDPIT